MWPVEVSQPAVVTTVSINGLACSGAVDGPVTTVSNAYAMQAETANVASHGHNAQAPVAQLLHEHAVIRDLHVHAELA